MNNKYRKSCISYGIIINTYRILVKYFLLLYNFLPPKSTVMQKHCCFIHSLCIKRQNKSPLCIKRAFCRVLFCCFKHRKLANSAIKATFESEICQILYCLLCGFREFRRRTCVGIATACSNRVFCFERHTLNIPSKFERPNLAVQTRIASEHVG